MRISFCITNQKFKPKTQYVGKKKLEMNPQKIHLQRMNLQNAHWHIRFRVILAQKFPQAMLLQRHRFLYYAMSNLYQAKKSYDGNHKTIFKLQMRYMNSLPETINIANVLNFDNWYLSARQPRLGFANPNATPPIRASHNIIKQANFNLWTTY